MTHRLYLRIWAGFVMILVVALALSGVMIAWQARSAELPDQVRGAVSLVLERLPPTEQQEDYKQELRRVSRRMDADITVRDAAGLMVGHAGRPLPSGDDGTFHADGRIGFRTTLEDGREVSVATRHGGAGFRGRWGSFLALVGLVLAVGAYPLARGITGRLEATREAVVAWGAGDVGARAPVLGTDEVADVAMAFNEAAARVQASLQAQRRTLASVSHELRSPLARVRMALELLDDADPARADLLAGAVRDVEELDATVGDLLDVGRLQAQGVTHRQPVAMRALLDEEGAHVDARVEGPAYTASGDPRLLRRLARNLLENARHHGGGEVEAWTTATGFVVADRGPGVPPAEAEAIFEPFHRRVDHREGADGGVGLGLWLVREIATRHGGAVRHRAREGGGSCFEVRLPPA